MPSHLDLQCLQIQLLLYELRIVLYKFQLKFKVVPSPRPLSDQTPPTLAGSQCHHSPVVDPELQVPISQALLKILYSLKSWT